MNEIVRKERHQGMDTLQTNIDQIADDIYRISTWIPDVSPEGFTFNQFLITAAGPATTVFLAIFFGLLAYLVVGPEQLLRLALAPWTPVLPDHDGDHDADHGVRHARARWGSP